MVLFYGINPYLTFTWYGFGVDEVWMRCGCAFLNSLNKKGVFIFKIADNHL